MGDRPLPSPGWYSDPTGRHTERWWDGTSWTARTNDPPPPVASPRSRPRRVGWFSGLLLSVFGATVCAAAVVEVRSASGGSLTSVAGKVTHVTGHDDGTGHMAYTVVVHFDDLAAAGHVLVAEFSAGGHPQPGDDVVVEFDPLDPEGASLREPHTTRLWGRLAVVGAMSSAVGAAVMVAAHRRRRSIG